MTPLWGLTDEVSSRPNWINLATYPVGTTLIFVDQDEAQTEAAKLKGIKAPGWYLYREYQDNADPVQTRYKTELIVAARRTFAEAGDDVADDTILTDYTLYITAQPADLEVTEGDAAEFTVAAESNPAGTNTFQWQKYNTSTEEWDNIALATSTTYEIAVTTLASTGEYRVVVTAEDTTTELISEVATLVVLEA